MEINAAANMYPAKLPTVLDCSKCVRENTLNYGKT